MLLAQTEFLKKFFIYQRINASVNQWIDSLCVRSGCVMWCKGGRPGPHWKMLQCKSCWLPCVFRILNLWVFRFQISLCYVGYTDKNRWFWQGTKMVALVYLTMKRKIMSSHSYHASIWLTFIVNRSYKDWPLVFVNKCVLCADVNNISVKKDKEIVRW